MARWLGAIDPMSVKLEAATPNGRPVFYSVQEQWESWAQALAGLENRHVLVKLAGKPAVQIRTLHLPPVKAKPQDIEQVKAHYRKKLMRTRDEIILPHQQRAQRPEGPTVARRVS